jgi:hypothetical protein
LIASSEHLLVADDAPSFAVAVPADAGFDAPAVVVLFQLAL